MHVIILLYFALFNITTHTFIWIVPTTPPASFLYAFYYRAIFKSPLNVPKNFHHLKSKQAIASGAL